jgi:hypothetical protein
MLERIVRICNLRRNTVQIILEKNFIRISVLPSPGRFHETCTCNPRASALSPSGPAHTATAD